RWLAFQELGSSAAQCNAEAIECNSTFVFVLPASRGAVRAAMDKVILPQLDPRTKPKNLATRIARVVATADGSRPDGVPVVISSEKTATGSGMAPKLPASASKRNIVVRKPAEPPTKIIEQARLQRALEASSGQSHDAVTKPFDLVELLPKLP